MLLTYSCTVGDGNDGSMPFLADSRTRAHKAIVLSATRSVTNSVTKSLLLSLLLLNSKSAVGKGGGDSTVRSRANELPLLGSLLIPRSLLLLFPPPFLPLLPSEEEVVSKTWSSIASDRDRDSVRILCAALSNRPAALANKMLPNR